MTRASSATMERCRKVTAVSSVKLERDLQPQQAGPKNRGAECLLSHHRRRALDVVVALPEDVGHDLDPAVDEPVAAEGEFAHGVGQQVIGARIAKCLTFSARAREGQLVVARAELTFTSASTEGQ